jgi:4-alpha-methyl-delta7-sterol-4alpha-methyl oxidase
LTLVPFIFRIFGTDKGYRKLKALKEAEHNYDFVEEKVAKTD